MAPLQIKSLNSAKRIDKVRELVSKIGSEYILQNGIKLFPIPWKKKIRFKVIIKQQHYWFGPESVISPVISF